MNLYKFFSLVERFSQYFQGKGYGGFSINSEVKSIKKLLKLDRDVRVAIDIGGNIGDYTEALMETFPGIEVHTFEPSESNVKKLKLRFSKQKKIKTQQFGVSNKNDTMTLYSNKEGSGLASLSKRKLEHLGIDFNLEEKVKIIRFEDYWVDSLERREIDILKMDIEGYELFALEGLGSAIKHIKTIQIEFGGGEYRYKDIFSRFLVFFCTA